jgi:hypothetical protein
MFFVLCFERMPEFIAGDRTIQMSSFMDIFDAAVLTWGSHHSDVKFHGHFDAAVSSLSSWNYD